MEPEKNAIGITIEEAELSLKKGSREWVDKELSDGIEQSVHYWKGGHYKQLFSMMVYKSVIVPYLVVMIFVLSILIEETKAIWITGGVLAGYVALGLWIHRRTKLRFLLSQESMTLICGRKKTVIPWEKVKNITHVSSEINTGFEKRGRSWKVTRAVSYELKVQTEKQYYNFYNVYKFPHDLVVDDRGKINLPLLPLHIICVLMQTAREKVKEV